MVEQVFEAIEVDEEQGNTDTVLCIIWFLLLEQGVFFCI